MKNYVKSSNIRQCLQDTVPIVSNSNRKLKNRQKLGVLERGPEIFQGFSKISDKTFKLQFNGVVRNFQDENLVARLRMRACKGFRGGSPPKAEKF